MAYYLNTFVSLAFDAAVERVKEELKKQGFGVLTEIDVRETLKKKLGVEFRNYRILGACNPPFAHKALLAEDKIGVLLPCNVTVQEHTVGRVEVAAVDPLVSMQAVGNPALSAVAAEVQGRLKLVIAGLGGASAV